MKKITNIIIDGEVFAVPHFSGIGHYALELLHAIDRQLSTTENVRIKVFVHFRHVDRVRAYGFKNISVVRSPFSLRISNGLKIRNKQPFLDLLFGKGVYVFPNFTSWPLLYSKSVPFIYDLSYEKYPQFAEPRNQVFLSEQVKKAARRADYIATISASSKQEICEFYKIEPEDVGVFYPAVDRSRYRRIPVGVVDSVKAKYGIVGDYILFVGNIEPRKNLKNILLAYEKLDSSLRKKYSLLLVGAKGWQDGEIFEIVDRLKKRGDSIQLPNAYVTDDDLPAIYSGATVFVYPSIYEGFGIPPLEAMACGVPVVSADNSSLPEAVGDAGLLVDALSSEEISSAMRKLLTDNNLCKELVARGYKQTDKFSWDTAAKQFIETMQVL